ncbi:hypothetical protein MKleb_5421 (plasmid) [Klebsiella sp. PL-2018]|nr:hypothetical protein MKleb_5421 [Klebsiella sp. PL-2018]
MFKSNDNVNFGTCFRAAVGDSHSLTEARKRILTDSFFLPFRPSLGLYHNGKCGGRIALAARFTITSLACTA